MFFYLTQGGKEPIASRKGKGKRRKLIDLRGLYVIFPSSLAGYYDHMFYILIP